MPGQHQQTVNASPPPELPQVDGMSDLLANYLRRFSAWSVKGFAHAVSTQTASPQIVLASTAGSDKTFAFRVDDTPTPTLTMLLPGSGADGTVYPIGGGGGLSEAPPDGRNYLRQGSTTSWVALVPASATPLMDGTAAVGSSALYARQDHIHPTDTSRYAASNPSGYQTAANVTASLASYLLLAGGTLTGPLTGVTATFSGLLTPTGGIAGVTSGSNAAAGQVGEVISNVVTTNVPLSTGVTTNVATISLSAGDWDVQGEVWISASANVLSNILAAINSVSATYPASPALGAVKEQLTGTLVTAWSASLAPCRVNLSSPATYYLVAFAAFASGTTNAVGKIWARRAR